MFTQDYVIFLRDRLKNGDQKEIANTIGISHSHVRNILSGIYGYGSETSQQVVRAVENKVYTRFEKFLQDNRLIFSYRPDFKKFFQEQL